MATEKLPKKKLNKKTLLIALAGIVVLCVIIAIVSSNTPTGNIASTKHALTSTADSIPTITITPPPTLAPTQTLEPKAALESAIELVLGTSNRNVDRVREVAFDSLAPGDVWVVWTINDNLTEDLLKWGIHKDAADILETIAKSGYPFDRVLLNGSFPLVDTFGNTAETVVVSLVFNKATVDKINWINFLSENIYMIADEAELHPVMQ